jgi:cytochrome c oxidase subunit 4
MSGHDDHLSHDHVNAPDDGLVHVHVHPASTYYKIFGALVFFTLLTIGAAQVHLGEWNFFVAVLIATVKASLVAMFFMHLKDDNRFNVLIFVGALVFMGVFFVYTMNDTQHRGQWDNSYGTEVSDSGEVAPGRGLFQEIHVKPAEHGEGHAEGHDAAEGAEHH